jgi:hypothetical protein
MRLRSNAFADGGGIPRRFTCEGEDTSPPLAWSEPPSPTQSFVLLCDDPDAPGGIWHHWAAYDIPADRTGLPEGVGRSSTGDLAQAVNDFGRVGYGGPCPPRIIILSGCWRCRPIGFRLERVHRAATWTEKRASTSSPRRPWSGSTGDDAAQPPAS